MSEKKGEGGRAGKRLVKRGEACETILKHNREIPNKGRASKKDAI